MRPSWSKTTVARCELWPVLKNSTVAQAKGQLGTVYFTSFMFIKNASKLKQKNRCAVWIRTCFKKQHSYARYPTIAHILFYKSYVSKQCVQVEAKQQLRGELGPVSNNTKVGHATGQLRTVYFTSFMFLNNASKLKQNKSCAVWIMASFKEQHSCARNGSVGNSSFYKFYVYKQCVQIKAKQQVRSVN